MLKKNPDTGDLNLLNQMEVFSIIRKQNIQQIQNLKKSLKQTFVREKNHNKDLQIIFKLVKITVSFSN